MKILRAFEYIAAVMIVAGIVLALGKVAVDEVVARTMRPAFATVAVAAPSDEEITQYRDGLKQSLWLLEMKDRAEMEAKSRGER